MRVAITIMILCLLLFASVVLAAPHSGETHSAATDANPKMRQAYEASMASMHMGMETAVKETNPDVSFAKGMLAHHKGAVEMANIELQYGSDPVMKNLAREIVKAQEKEIDLLERWLEAHDK